MTYCVGLYLREGLVLLSDTRTNAGVDNISTFSKMHVFEKPGERLMVMLTRGVCRAIPRFFAIALPEVTTPLAMRPGPPSFSLAKTKIVSPLAMCLPPYIVFCALNANVFARGSLTSALIANVMFFPELPRVPSGPC